MFSHRNHREYWGELKNKYAGNPGWVIGNGPSLRMDDLEKIKDQISIASNKIYLAFPDTAWRPTLVTCVDGILWPKIKAEAFARFEKIHLPHYLYDIADDLTGKVEYWVSKPPAEGPALQPMFSSNAVKGIHGGCTVTFENLQIAAHLGLNPIYIIGCDHYYAGEEDSSGRVSVLAPAESNHFHPEYRSKGEIVSPASIDKMETAYTHVKVWAENN